MNDERSYRGGIGLPQRSALQRRSTAPDTGRTRRPHHSHILRLTLMALLAILGLQGAWAQKLKDADIHYYSPYYGETVWTTKANCESYYAAGWMCNDSSGDDFDDKSYGITQPEAKADQNGIQFKNSGKKQVFFYVTGVNAIKVYTKLCSKLEGYTPNLQLIATASDDSGTKESETITFTEDNQEKQCELTGLDATKSYKVQVKNTNSYKDVTLFAIQFTTPYPTALNVPVALNSDRISHFSRNTGFPTSTFNSCTFSNNNNVGIIANDTHTITKTSDGFKFSDPGDAKRAYIVIKPQSPGLLKISVKGADLETGDHYININTSTEWDADDKSPIGFGWHSSGQVSNTVTSKEKYFSTNPGTLYIAATNGVTITDIEWTPVYYHEFKLTSSYSGNTNINVDRFLVLANSERSVRYVDEAKSFDSELCSYNDSHTRLQSTTKKLCLDGTSQTGGYERAIMFKTKNAEEGNGRIFVYAGQCDKTLMLKNMTTGETVKQYKLDADGSWDEVSTPASGVRELRFNVQRGQVYSLYSTGSNIDIYYINSCAQLDEVKDLDNFNVTLEESHNFDSFTTYRLALSVKDKNNSDVNPAYYTVSYKSSNTAVATVDASGTVSSVGTGKATITATITPTLEGLNYFRGSVIATSAIHVESREPAVPSINRCEVITEDGNKYLKVTLVTGEGYVGDLGLLRNGGGLGATVTDGVAKVLLSSLGADPFTLMAYNTVGGQTKYSTPCKVVCIESSAILVNPDFEADGGAGWTVTGTGTALSMKGGNTSGNNCAEAFQMSSFNVYQELTGLPNGVYEVTVQAFNRGQEVDKAYAAYRLGDKDITTYLYANGYEVPVKSLYDEVVEDLRGTTDTKGGNKYPNMPNSSADAFSKGNYQVKLLAWVTDGKLKIGIKGGSNKTGSWSSWDNFSVRRKGGVDDITGAEDYLVPLTGDKVWTPTFGFVENETHEPTASPAQYLNDKHELLLCALQSSSGNTKITKVYGSYINFPGGSANGGLKFKIPAGPGTIKVYVTSASGNTPNSSSLVIKVGDTEYKSSGTNVFTKEESSSECHICTATVQSIAESLVHIYTSSYGYRISQVEYIQEQQLRTLPGTYKWNAKIDNFGIHGKYEPASNETQDFLVNNNYLQYITYRKDAKTARGVTVTNYGIELYNTSDNGVRFKIPGQGEVVVKARRTSKPNGVMRILVNGAEVKKQTWNPQMNDDEDGYVTTLMTYDGTSEATVEITMGNSDGVNTFIKEIAYYQITPLTPQTEENSTNNGWHHWDGNTNWSRKGGSETEGKNTPHSDLYNSRWNTIRIMGDDTHTVTVVNGQGYTFSAKGEGDAGFLMVPVTVPGTLRVYTRQEDQGKEISISVGSGPEANFHPLQDVDANGVARYIKLFTNNPNRYAFISAEPGVVITKIEWKPGVEIGTTEDLRPVTTETVWARSNKFGGYDYPSGENTFVLSPENQLNIGTRGISGLPPVANSTLLIYGGGANLDSQPTYFTTSGNLMLNNSARTDGSVVGGIQRVVQFKVKGRGVVKVELAANGSSARGGVNISAFNETDDNKITKEQLISSSILTGENHDETLNGQPTANEQEHIMNFVRHQHSSYHAVYGYYDGPDDLEQSIYIWTPSGGVSIQEIHWYPAQTIYEVTGSNLSEEGCLKISDASGVVYESDGVTKKIPETIFINPRKTGYYTGKPAEMLTQTSYSFYARVTNEKEVSATVKEPVWTTSQAGRKGYQDKWIMSNSNVNGDRDQHTPLNADYKENDKWVAITGNEHPYTLNVVGRRVFDSQDDAKATAGDNNKYAEPTLKNIGDRDCEPSWGIMYVVAGTWEGNRNDIRRIEVAGPATRLDVVNNVEEIYLKPGMKFTIGARPVTEYNDLDAGGAYGRTVDMKYVEDPSKVTWYVVKGDEYIATVEDNNTIVNNTIERAVVAAHSAGETTLTISIPGVEAYTHNDKTVWVKKNIVKTVKIIVEESAITLTRVPLDGEVMKAFTNDDGTTTRSSDNIENVQVTSPLVYQITGDFYPKDETGDNGHKKTVLKLTVSSSDKGRIPVVFEAGGDYKQIDDNWYLVFDIVKQLQAGVGSPTQYFEHMDHGTEHTVTLKDVTDYGVGMRTMVWVNKTTEATEDGTTTATSERVSVPAAGCNILTFTTIPDDPGTEIETFIYNASQRAQLTTKSSNALKDDVTNGGLLKEHLIDVPFSADKIRVSGIPDVDGGANLASVTKSWYCNHRSYITLENFLVHNTGNAERDQHLQANGDATITIKPYNTTFTSANKQEAISNINIYCDESSTAGTIWFKKLDGTVLGSATVANGSVTEASWNAPTGDGNWVHDVKIEVSKGVLIDQIKIDYYSARRSLKTVGKTFGGYNAETFKEKVRSGMSIAGVQDSDPNILIKFKEQQRDNLRHFSLLERWSRDESNGATRGEKATRNKPKTALVMRDDKSDPCEMYIYNGSNVANIVSIEFVYEEDNGSGQNNFDARNIFCVSDPRYNPTEQVNMVGYPLIDMPIDAADYNNEDGGNREGLRKMVYKPESPVNFASFVLNCQQPGYVFVRKIIVRYEESATSNAYILKNTTNDNDARFNPAKVARGTTGLKISIPKVEIDDVKGYLIKRTSTQNNISHEVVLQSTSLGDLDVDNTGMKINSAIGKSNFLHQKYYTLRVLDNERMITRQLTFRTDVNESPKIKRYTTGSNFVENKEWRTEDPLTEVPSQVTITTTSADSHEPGNTVLIYTTDGSAPSVEFDVDGRTVKTVNGEIGLGSGVTFYHSRLRELFNTHNNSIVIKAIAMPLTDNTTLSEYSVQELRNLGAKTFGETSEVTRANYTLISPEETFFATARRDNNDNYSIKLKNSPYNIEGSKDKFHGAYRPQASDDNSIATMPEVFTYGGYELWKKAETQDEAAASLSGEFNHSLVKNEYWQVKGNDVTPWRGLRKIIGGDAYIVSSLEPFNEYTEYNREAQTVYASTDKDATADRKAYEFTDKDADIRFFKGQFDNTRHMDLAHSYERTWNLPCYGDYFLFEPTAPGMLTVYVKQQGVLEQENDHIDDQLLRFRPVYIYDEAGNTPARIQAMTTSKVSGDWMTMRHTDNVASKYLTSSAAEELEEMCRQWIVKNTHKDGTDGTQDGDIEFGDRAYHEQGVIALYGSIANAQAVKRADGDDFDYACIEGANRPAFLGERGEGNANGFMLISEGYVRYDIPVKAGKNYFVFAANGNLGFCSYTFKAESASAAKGNIMATATSADDVVAMPINNSKEYVEQWLESNMDKCMNISVERTFPKDTWAALVLPFSVGRNQVREIFGDGVNVSHYECVTDEFIQSRRHAHQMIVAGVPVLVRPSKQVVNPVFRNVTIEKSKVEKVWTNTSSRTDTIFYVATGTFGKTKAPNHSLYINASTGHFVHRVYGEFDIAGTRIWLEPRTATYPTKLYASFGESGIEDYEDEMPTDVDTVQADGSYSDGNTIYNLNGQLVRKGSTSLEGLPAGVYIVNGIKQVVR